MHVHITFLHLCVFTRCAWFAPALKAELATAGMQVQLGMRPQAAGAVRAPHQRAAVPSSSARCITPARRSVSMTNWKTFGPSSHYSDGDAEYFQVTNRLQQQYELFTPRPEQPEQQDVSQPGPSNVLEQGATQRTRPEFGLSARQIAALGLSGPRLSTPDPVSALGCCGGSVVLYDDTINTYAFIATSCWVAGHTVQQGLHAGGEVRSRELWVQHSKHGRRAYVRARKELQWGTGSIWGLPQLS